MKGTPLRARRSLAVCVAFLVLAGPLCAQSKSVLPVFVDIPFVTAPVIANGKHTMIYEIHLTNYWKKTIRLERIEVLDSETKTSILAIEDRDLAESLYIPKCLGETSETNVIECGRNLVIFMWVVFEKEEKIYNQIFHRLTFSVLDSDSNENRLVDGGSISIPRSQPVSLHRPISKGYWLIGDGPANSSEHRRAVMAVDGSRWLSQRFAFDAMRMGDDGKIVRGNPSHNENWVSYGEDLLAVADGVVSLVIDGIPDNEPLSPTRAVPMNRETHVGNCVILDIGEGNFAFYAHMKSGSIPSKTGDKVRRGDVIGKIGNSGNSEAPHLHFSVGTQNDPFSAEGLPYVFKSFEIIDIILQDSDEMITDGIDAEVLTEAKRLEKRNEIPIGDPLLYFP